MSVIRVVCKKKDEFDYRKCIEPKYCHFVKTFKADCWMNDEVKCKCPLSVKKGDKIYIKQIHTNKEYLEHIKIEGE